MSFVGPRPERPFFVDQLVKQIPFYSLRHSTKPGITGWAQVRYPYGASVDDAIEKLQYDLYYVKNHGLFLDLMILHRHRGGRVVGEGSQMTGSWPNGERNRPMAIIVGTARYATAATACRFLFVLLVANWCWRVPGVSPGNLPAV